MLGNNSQLSLKRPPLVHGQSGRLREVVAYGKRTTGAQKGSEYVII